MVPSRKPTKTFQTSGEKRSVFRPPLSHRKGGDDEVIGEHVGGPAGGKREAARPRTDQRDEVTAIDETVYGAAGGYKEALRQRTRKR